VTSQSEPPAIYFIYSVFNLQAAKRLKKLTRLLSQEYKKNARKFYKTPFVEGNSPKDALSRAHAALRALAKALNEASIMWCVS